MSSEFSIRFLDVEPFREEGMAPAAHGLLTIGDWQEDFYSSLYAWNQEDYARQWREAIDILLNGGTRSALITEYLTPEVSSHLVWWPMYRVGRSVHVQNHLLFFDVLESPFSLESPYSSLKDHERVSETGDPISEWSCDLEDLEGFRRRNEI